MSTDGSYEEFRRDSRAEEIEQQAADWLALREVRELTSSEANAFAAWRAADVRHQEALTELMAAWRTFDRLQGYPRRSDLPDDPDALSGRRRSRIRLPMTLAAAAAIVLAGVLWLRPAGSEQSPVGAVAAAATTLRLPDGSEVEFRAGSEVVPLFTPEERRVRLVRGEAHFTVSKNAAWPFVVEADGVAVRAVGTAFNVRLDPSAVEVLVTEGVVKVGVPEVAHADEVPTLGAGQRTSVATVPTTATTPVVETLAPIEIDRALAWQTSRLVFDATPLSVVVEKFNRHTGRRIVLRDSTLGALPISGRFRAGNIESFLELLESGFGISVDRSGDEIVLRRRSVN
ncbi:MAG TPA: FecR domain-containing protein [Opitutaceae bacterium]|nr:FecR domain-containing protein [Opitutaceae bacterium]